MIRGSVAGASHEIWLLSEVLEVLRMSRRTFERLRRAGLAPIPEILPRLGRRPRYRGKDLEAWVRGTTGKRTFGGNRSPRFGKW